MKRGQRVKWTSHQEKLPSKSPALLGLTHMYLVKRSLTHNKYLTILFLEDNDSISAKYAAQILSLNLAQTFLHLNFLVTGLYSSSASYSFTLAPDPVSLSKNL